MPGTAAGGLVSSRLLLVKAAAPNLIQVDWDYLVPMVGFLIVTNATLLCWW
jgi:hypothetical protein